MGALLELTPHTSIPNSVMVDSLEFQVIPATNQQELSAALANPQVGILITDEGPQAALKTLMITALAAGVIAATEIVHHAIAEHYQITGEASIELNKRGIVEFKGKVVLKPPNEKKPPSP
jgi:hypothetical protein